MPNLYVVRHGETDFNKQGKYLGRMDIELNSSGIIQAKELAAKLSVLDVDIIYCSPLKRTIKTAELIKDNNNCKVITDNHLIERSMGVYEGLTKSQAKNNYPDVYKRNITRIFNEAPPGGETVDDVMERVFFALDKIREQKKFTNIIIVTHGFVAKVINKYFASKITDQEFFDFSLGNAEIKNYKF